MAILAIDLGLKRIGLAFSPDNKIALLLNPIIRKNRDQAANEVKRIIADRNVDFIVLGLPLGGNAEDEMKRRGKHFINLLDFADKFAFQDESDSSIEAAELLQTKDKRDGKLDSIAALVILNRYLSKRS
ncbi:MAG: Holliday junction resolvase RuvX [Helicobacteraceae bacterium]|nr:Holliday junction resolvase RuvX [Helicobacteraceae bacterium]